MQRPKLVPDLLLGLTRDLAAKPAPVAGVRGPFQIILPPGIPAIVFLTFGWADRTFDRYPAGAMSMNWCCERPYCVGDRVLLDASFSAARARLEILVTDGMLPWASEVAYGEGITGLVKARPARRLA